jgi:DDE superfamily endonuclease
MLNYENLKEKPRKFLAATGLTEEEFEILQPNFRKAYEKRYPSDLTFDGQARQRGVGGGVKGTLSKFEERLLFILVYQKTNPLQTMHGLQFGLSQPQTNYWIHRLLPVLQQTLAALGMRPERDARLVATNPETTEGGANLAIDGTERRLQRPVDPIKQKEKYSGKKKAHTDKNILLANENTKKVIYLSPTVEGKKHDSRAAKEVAIVYPANATLDKDTGFQGYEPEDVLTHQPKKKRKVKS